MIIAVDTGGTKTLVARFSQRGVLEKSERFATPKDLQTYLDTLLTTIELVSEHHELTAISIALPGQIKDKTTLIFAEHIGWIHDINIRALLQTTYECPIFVENDANLAGLSEIRQLPHVPNVGLYITISTGIGTGLLVNGTLAPGLSASEGGHMVLERDGVLATWESFASGSAIYARYKKYASDIKSHHAWQEIAKDISLGIIALAPLLRPDVIVIGGSIGTHFDKYEHALTGLIKERLRADFVPKLVRAAHPEQAVIYGCYLYAIEQLDT